MAIKKVKVNDFINYLEYNLLNPEDDFSMKFREAVVMMQMLEDSGDFKTEKTNLPYLSTPQVKNQQNSNSLNLKDIIAEQRRRRLQTHPDVAMTSQTNFKAGDIVFNNDEKSKTSWLSGNTSEVACIDWTDCMTTLVVSLVLFSHHDAFTNLNNLDQMSHLMNNIPCWQQKPSKLLHCQQQQRSPFTLYLSKKMLQ